MNENQDTEDLRVDIQKIKTFVLKHSTTTLLLLLLVLQFIPNYGFLPWGSIWIRLQYQDLPLAEHIAEQSISKALFDKVSTTINQQQPHLPEQQKRAFVEQELQRIFSTDPGIKAEITKTASRIKNEFSYSLNGTTYTFIPSVDTYYYLRLTENILKHGHVGDTLKDGLMWDAHAVAPRGSNVSTELHPYALAYFHKIAKIFSSDVPLMQSSAYFPLVSILITFIVLFFIGKQLHGLIGAFITPTLFSLNYITLTRTYWGYIDTDIYLFLFPAVFIIFFTNLFFTTTKLSTLLYAFAASITIALYAFAWTGWWSLFMLSGATVFIFVGITIVKNYQQHKPLFADVTPILQVFLLFFMLSTFFISIALGYRIWNDVNLSEGFGRFADQIFGPLSFIKIKNVARTDLWPNVYTTVSELHSADLTKVIASLGGTFVVIFALLGLFILFKKMSTPLAQFYSIFLTLLITASLYASFQAQRFILLLMVPVAITASTLLSYFYNKLTTKHPHFLTRIFVLFGGLIILSFLITPQITQSEQFINTRVPIMNKAFDDALTAIKQNSPPNAIILSWWDFGHIFSTITDRPVIFDGGSQNTPLAHWVGKFFATSDEKEALGIIRMLSCGSNKAYDVLYEQTRQNTLKTITLLTTIIKMDFKDAQNYLEKNAIVDTEQVLSYTHCTPPETYLITSEDMRNKAHVWSRLGNWNFERAHLLQIINNQQRDKMIETITTTLNRSASEATELYEEAQRAQSDQTSWVSPSWSFFDTVAPCTNTQTDISCNPLFVVNKQNYEPQLNIQAETTAPKTFVYLDDTTENFMIKNIDNTSGHGAILFNDDSGAFYGMISTPELTTSMFTRLHYFNAQGLKHFKPFIKRKIFYGGFINVWTVDWQGTSTTQSPFFQTKDTVTPTSTIVFNILSWLDTGEILDSTISTWKQRNLTPTTQFDEYTTTPRIRKLGTQQMIPQLEKAVLDMKIHETKTVRILPQELFADPLIIAKIGNRTVNFKIRIEKIR